MLMHYIPEVRQVIEVRLDPAVCIAGYITAHRLHATSWFASQHLFAIMAVHIAWLHVMSLAQS